MVLNEDFRAFIKLLNDHDVKYLIVGGYAVALHGYPRYTKDLDFWVWLNQENAEKIIKTLHKFGFAALGLTTDDFLNAENVVQLGYPPNQIDLITEVTGLTFEPCFANRQEVEMEGLKINFIALDDLIENKRQTGRLQDKADVEKLLKSKRKK